MNLREFSKSRFRSLWISEPGLEAYVRKSIHKGIDIDLANLAAVNPGNGAFTLFLDTYESTFVFRVESIVNPNLCAYLKKRGYVRMKTESPLQIDMCSKALTDLGPAPVARRSRVHTTRR